MRPTGPSKPGFTESADLFGVNLAFVALVPAVCANLIRGDSQSHELKPRQWLLPDGIYFA